MPKPYIMPKQVPFMLDTTIPIGPQLAKHGVGNMHECGCSIDTKLYFTTKTGQFTKEFAVNSYYKICSNCKIKIKI